MQSLNLDFLRAFVTVMELGSFSAAAARLNLSQPAISQQVRQLEKRLGVPLVERVGRRARPTAAGTALLAHAQRIDAAVSSALDAVAPHGTGTAGRVRLGTGATACIFLLPPVLRQLRLQYPDIEITVTTGNTADIVAAVEENSIDLGLVTMPAAGRSLEVRPVIDDEFVAIAPAGMRLPARLTPAALAKQPVLAFEPGGNTRRIADEWFARAGVEPRTVMSLGSVEALKEMVGAGLGCAILPQMAVRRERDQGALQVRPLTPRLHRRLAIVVRRDKPLYRPLGAAVELIQGLANL